MTTIGGFETRPAATSVFGLVKSANKFNMYLGITVDRSAFEKGRSPRNPKKARHLANLKRYQF
jgi:hypothetical protein